MKFNKDDARRIELLTPFLGRTPAPGYDIARFSGLTLPVLRTLIAEGFVDLEEAQNYSPTIAELLAYMELHLDTDCHGYIVRPSREDYRLSIEGLEQGDTPTTRDIIDFTELCRHADDFKATEDGLYSWWD